MKYGETLRQRSIPAWSGYNIDYDDIKNFIKERTTPGQGKTVTVPGRGDDVAQKFESELYLVLEEQHQRIDLFVKSKAREIQHRLDDAKKRLRQLAARNSTADHRIPVSRLERYGRLETGVVKAGEEIKSLARFTSTQRTAFRKLLKKYKKWTGSSQLQEKFQEQVLDDLKSFTNYDLGPLLDDYSETLYDVRALYEAKLQKQAPTDTRTHASAKSPGKSSIANLESGLANGSRTDFDTTFATAPLCEGGTFSSYFVHPENVVELQVLLLQHMRYLFTRSRHNSLAAPSSPSQRPETPTSARPSSDFFALAADSPDRFIHEQSGLTVDQREHRVGATLQRTKLCARWQDEDETSIAARTGGAAMQVSSMKRKHVGAFFDKERPFQPRRGSSQSFNGCREELDSIRQLLTEDEQINPLYLLSCCRSRLVGINNSSKSVLAAALDTTISFQAPEGLETSSVKSEFPFAVLQVRQDGAEQLELLKVLDQSHLAERVPGFSMEYHAIWQVCKPQNAPVPFWIPTLSQDIRKLPPKTTRRSAQTNAAGSGAGTGTDTATGTDSPSATLGSNGSVTGATDSTTAIETRRQGARFSDDQISAPPLRAFRKKRRREYPEDRQSSQPQSRYWSEYDHPEDGSETSNAYMLYFDPNEKSAFEIFFDRLGALFSRKRRSPETESLLGSPGTPRDDETSSDEEEAVAPPPKLRRANTSTYGTLSTHRAQSSKAASFKQPLVLLPHFATTCFTASLAILVVAYILAGTGKRKLVKEVDAGIVFAVVSSLVFAVVGFGSLLRDQDVRWVSWLIAVGFLLVDAIGSGGLFAWMLG